jgi:hypothetical protein
MHTHCDYTQCDLYTALYTAQWKPDSIKQQQLFVQTVKLALKMQQHTACTCLHINTARYASTSSTSGATAVALSALVLCSVYMTRVTLPAACL